MFVNLELQLHNSIGIVQPDFLPVDLHRPVAQYVERLRLFHQSARDPFVTIHVNPLLARLQSHCLLAETQGENAGSSLAVALFACLDPSFLQRGRDHAGDNQRHNDRQHCAGYQKPVSHIGPRNKRQTVGW